MTGKLLKKLWGKKHCRKDEPQNLNISWAKILGRTLDYVYAGKAPESPADKQQVEVEGTEKRIQMLPTTGNIKVNYLLDQNKKNKTLRET